MNYISLQKLLLSTNKETAPFVQLPRIVETNTFNTLSNELTPIIYKADVIVGDCVLCGIHGSVKFKVLEDSVVELFETNGCSNRKSCASVCISCEATINRVTDLQNILQSAQDELDSIAAGVNSILHIRRTRETLETDNVKGTEEFDIKQELSMTVNKEGLIGGSSADKSNQSVGDLFNSSPRNLDSRPGGCNPSVADHAGSTPSSNPETGHAIPEIQDFDEIHAELASKRTEEVDIIYEFPLQLEINQVEEASVDAVDSCDVAAAEANNTPIRSTGTSSRTTLMCETCNKTFKTAFKLKSHLKSHRDGKTRALLECCFCTQRFQHSTLLALHYQTHKDNDHPGKCGECGKIMTSFGSLKLHHVWVHGTKEQKMDVRQKRKLHDNPNATKCDTKSCAAATP